ncbi:hypothetical protein [Lamprocystis purpurea]|jgi:hypothetical protein|uniref:hypothetical protein n=1 Tax=Lamprocystis purpurea TaxID=61598 RepID=UPI0003A1E8F2|nr:hypothetical protein [Lamprocystis purpurea]
MAAAFAEIGTTLDGFAARMGAVVETASRLAAAVALPWQLFRGTVEGAGALVAGFVAILGAWVSGVAGLFSAAVPGLAGWAAQVQARTDAFADAAGRYATAAKGSFGDAADSFLRVIGLQAAATSGAAAGAQAAAAAADDWRIDQAALNAELRKAGVLITEQDAKARAAAIANLAAADGSTASTNALKAQKKAAEEAAKALAGVADAAQAVADAQAGAGSENWADASLSATRAAQEIDVGQPVAALGLIEAGLRALERAARSGDTSAGLELTRRQLVALAAEAEAALQGTAKALEPKAVGTDAQADELRAAYAGLGLSAADAERAVRALNQTIAQPQTVAKTAQVDALRQSYDDLGLAAEQADRAAGQLQRRLADQQKAPDVADKQQSKADTPTAARQARRELEAVFSAPIPLSFYSGP